MEGSTGSQLIGLYTSRTYPPPGYRMPSGDTKERSCVSASLLYVNASQSVRSACSLSGL